MANGEWQMAGQRTLAVEGIKSSHPRFLLLVLSRCGLSFAIHQAMDATVTCRSREHIRYCIRKGMSLDIVVEKLKDSDLEVTKMESVDISGLGFHGLN